MNQKFKAYLIAGISGCAVAWLVGSYLEATLGTIAWIVPGLVTVAGMYIDSKIENKV